MTASVMVSVLILTCLWGVDMFKARYRIATDEYKGYEVQFKPWYSPFYRQIGDPVDTPSNTNSTIDDAEWLIKAHKSGNIKSRVVKYVD